jgi:hypothetical protein
MQTQTVKIDRAVACDLYRRYNEAAIRQRLSY